MSNLLLKSDLNLNFRGERDYIYGPDLFSYSIDTVFSFLKTDVIFNVDFSSHDMAHSGLGLYLYDGQDDEKHDRIQSKLVFQHDNNEYFAYLVRNETAVSTRIPYPEEEVFNACQLDNESKTIYLREQTSFLLTDNYTALTKFMHKNIYPDIKGKWIFVRILYNQYKLTQEYNELKVVSVKNFRDRYTQNELYIDDKMVGTLYFSLI